MNTNEFAVGDLVQKTDGTVMQVYTVTRLDGSTYLSLRDYPNRDSECNGRLSDYQAGFWGGPVSKIT